MRRWVPWLVIGGLLGGCVADPGGGDVDAGGQPDAALPDAAAPCDDDRFGPGTEALPAASLGLGVEEGLVLCGAEPDVFALDAPLGLAVAVSLQADRPVRLRVPGVGEEEGRNPMIRLRIPASGAVAVVTALEPGPPVSYRLQVGVAPADCDDDQEPDGADSPRRLAGSAEGTACAGDVDWLRLGGPPGAAVDLRIEALGGEGVAAAVVGGDGVDVTAEATLPALVPPGGELDLRIAPLGGGAAWRVTAAVGPAGVVGAVRGRVEGVDRPLVADALGPPVAAAVPGAVVEVRQGGRLAGRGLADAAGAFSVEYAGGDAAFELRVIAAVERAVGRVAVGPPGAGPWASAPVAVVDGQGVELAVDPEAPIAAALHAAGVVADGLERAAPFWSPRPDAPPVRVDWSPSVQPACGTCFRPASGHIELAGSRLDEDAWDDAVILHELGHVLAAVHARDDSPGGRHDGRRTWPPLAWSEGFAAFHAAWQLGDPRLVDARAGGARVVDLSAPLPAEQEGTADGTLAGDVSEVLVAAVLWSLFVDGVPEERLLGLLLGGLAEAAPDVGAAGLDLADALDRLACSTPPAVLEAAAAAHGYPWAGPGCSR
ncbi:MAG: hypothetical protein H6706_27110 [Myxococcales bacterium]|nr:hypothetical protein [Myxococcales bacterium]